MPFGGIPQLSIGHKLSGHSQLDYDITSFPKSKGLFSLFSLENGNFFIKSRPFPNWISPIAKSRKWVYTEIGSAGSPHSR